MEIFDVDKFKSLLKTNQVGRNIIYKEVTGTSMDDAKMGAFNGNPHGSIYLSEIQTKARGARDHKWDAMSKGNLYFSVIIHRPPPQTEESIVERVDLECVAGLSLLKVLEELDISDLSLKWQNDLWCRGHKMAGSLAENGGYLAGGYVYILGVGMNVNSDIRRHPDLHVIASSVKCEKNGLHLCREELFANFCLKLEHYLQYNHDQVYEETMKYQLFKTGDFVNVIERYGRTYIAQLEKIRKDWKVELRDECGRQIVGMKEFSLRPIKTKYIYVYTGILALTWSADCLIRTLKALVDTSVYTVETLDESHFTAGHWRGDAVMIVIGDLDMSRIHPQNYFDPVVDFVAGGRSAFVIRNGSYALYPDIKQQKDSEPSVYPVPVHAASFNGNEIMVNALSLGKPVVLQGQEDSEVWGYYGNIDQSENSLGQPEVAVAIHKYQDGQCAMFGFNVEITYADLQMLNIAVDGLCSSLEEKVFDRDSLILFMLHQCGVE